MHEASGPAGLLLKLYELRTEAALRDARSWFAFEFHPTSTRDVLSTWLGPGHESAPYRMVTRQSTTSCTSSSDVLAMWVAPHSGAYRMVTTYWDMAASLVVQNAIPADMFNAANTEHIALYAKLRPFLEEIRETTRYPDYLQNVEDVVMSLPDTDERIAIFERYVARQKTLAEQGKQRQTYSRPQETNAIAG